MTNRQTVGALGVALSTGLLAGCTSGGGSYVPKPVTSVTSIAPREGVDQNYIPIAEGNQWTFTAETIREINKRQSHPPDQEVIYKITKVEKVPEGQQVTWDIKVGGQPSDRQVWIVSDKGIYQSEVGLKKAKKFTTPQPLILFPVADHQTFEWRGSGLLPDGTLGSNVVKTQIIGMQEADTEMGRVHALAISSDLDYATRDGRGSGNSTIWLAPGMGIVRIKQTVGQESINHVRVIESVTLRLKSHS